MLTMGLSHEMVFLRSNNLISTIFLGKTRELLNEIILQHINIQSSNITTSSIQIQ